MPPGPDIVRRRIGAHGDRHPGRQQRGDELRIDRINDDRIERVPRERRARQWIRRIQLNGDDSMRREQFGDERLIARGASDQPLIVR